jgi:3-carboxy-cis,cis-muconate cycloisomerase
MLMATAAGFSHAEACLEGLLVQSERMQANLQSAFSLPLAELASFRLSEEMPRDEAKAVVKAACETALEEGRDLLEVLAATSGCPEVDWQALRDHTAWLGASGTFIERALKDWREG